MAGELNDLAAARVLRHLVRPVPAETAESTQAGRFATATSGLLIGEIIRRLRDLTPGQVETISAHQQLRGSRFGEAAVDLGLASAAEVTWALAQQFQYAYQPTGGSSCDPELVMARDPFGAQAEMFRDLRSQLLEGCMAPAQPRNALAIVSVDSGDGKTFVAANLAVGFSQLGARTLLVEGDMRVPRLQSLFRLTGGVGLSNVLAGRADPEVVQCPQDLPNLHVLTVGTPPPNPLELLHRSTMPLLMQRLVESFDHVIVDTPAAAVGADFRVLSAVCGASLVIGRQGRTRLQDLDKLLGALGKSPARVAGVLMNAH